MHFNLTSTTTEEDFHVCFFTIQDEEIECELHLQSPWLPWLVLDCAHMIVRKLMLAYVTSTIVESFKTSVFVIWIEDNSEKHRYPVSCAGCNR